jgi:hypothetical protein
VLLAAGRGGTGRGAGGGHGPLGKEQALQLVFPGAGKIVELRHLLGAQETAAVEACSAGTWRRAASSSTPTCGEGAPADFAIVVAEIGKVRPSRTSSRCGPTDAAAAWP